MKNQGYSKPEVQASGGDNAGSTQSLCQQGKCPHGVEEKQAKTGKQQSKRRESWGTTYPLGRISKHGPHWVTEEREIHRVPRWGSVACYEKQVDAEGKEVVYWAAALCL